MITGTTSGFKMDVISDIIGHHKSLLLINHRFDRQTHFEKKTSLILYYYKLKI